MVVDTHTLKRSNISQFQVVRLYIGFNFEIYIQFLLDKGFEFLDAVRDQAFDQMDVPLEASNVNLMLENFEEGLIGVKNGQLDIPG